MPALSSTRDPVTVGTVARNVLTHPWSLLFAWNWKSGMLSGLFRGGVFALAAGFHRPGVARGLWVELVFRILVGGLWGSLLQAFRSAQPRWLAGLGVAVALPASIHVLEYAVLRAAHTTGILAGMILSVGVSVISLLVNWGLMQKGLLVTGKGSATLSQDIQHLPAIVAALLASSRQSGASSVNS